MIGRKRHRCSSTKKQRKRIYLRSESADHRQTHVNERLVFFLRVSSCITCACMHTCIHACVCMCTQHTCEACRGRAWRSNHCSGSHADGGDDLGDAQAGSKLAGRALSLKSSKVSDFFSQLLIFILKLFFAFS